MAKDIQVLQNRVALLLAAVRRRQRQAVESRVASLGLSSQKFWVLDALGQQDGCTLTKMLATLPIDQPTASRVLAGLRELGLVETATDPADRRKRQLQLTAEGARVARRCSAIAKQIRKAAVAGFSERELRDMGNFLERMLHNLDDLDDSFPPELELGKGLGGRAAKSSLWNVRALAPAKQASYWRSLRTA